MALIWSEELQTIQISEGIVHLGECNSCITLRLNPLSANYLMAKTDCQNLSQFCASKLILIIWMSFFYLSSAQINERAYQRAAEELAVVKREAVELKVTYKKGNSYN